MSYNFKKFELPPQPAPGSHCYATVNKGSGYVSIRRKTLDYLEMLNHRFAVLHWDSGKCAMGIQLVEESADDSFQFHVSPKKRKNDDEIVAYTLNSKQFFQKHNIDFSFSYRVKVSKDEKTGFIVLSGFAFKED